jgi:hypothetical protein
VLHEATEVYAYYSCLQSETNARIKAICGAATLPDPIGFRSHRDFVRRVLSQEVDLRARGTEYVHAAQEGPDAPSALYRGHMNSQGSPSEAVAAGYSWRPGTEVTELIAGAAKGGT